MSDQQPSDETTLTVGGVPLTGWTEVHATRGIELSSSSFGISMTDLAPGQANELVVREGDPCTLKLGEDLTVTGYVDVVEAFFDKQSHGLTVTGRGKCEDLVDCSAERPTGQFTGLNALSIAQELAAVYGIDVHSFGEPPGGPVIPQFNLMLGESAWDIIERICRFAGLLCYEGADGDLILGAVQVGQHASGAAEGVNVEVARGRFAMNERFSEYDIFLQALDVWNDLGEGGNQVATAKDPNVPRHRKKYLIAEGGAGGLSLAQPRADWEAARRLGRGSQVTVTVDSWRDSAGTLWTPNYQVPLRLPSAKVPIATWLLSEVTYHRDAEGTRADWTCMPDIAFTPQPILLQPIAPDLLPGAVPPSPK
jgi:prophage tail gpP-like protein